MATGRVKSVAKTGFGFITRDEQGSRRADLFFPRASVEGAGFDDLAAGQRVRFDEEADPRDPTRRRAVNVRPSPGEDR